MSSGNRDSRRDELLLHAAAAAASQVQYIPLVVPYAISRQVNTVNRYRKLSVCLSPFHKLLLLSAGMLQFEKPYSNCMLSALH